MVKRTVCRVVGLVGAAVVFALAHGYGEYQIARSARTYIVVNGLERDLTPQELVSIHLIGDALRAIPFGVLAAGLLWLPLVLVARRLGSVPAVAGYLGAVVAGA